MSTIPICSFLYLELTLQSDEFLNVQRGWYKKKYSSRYLIQVILAPPSFCFFSKVKYYWKGCSLSALRFVLSDRFRRTLTHRNYVLHLFFGYKQNAKLNTC